MGFGGTLSRGGVVENAKFKCLAIVWVKGDIHVAKMHMRARGLGRAAVYLIIRIFFNVNVLVFIFAFMFTKHISYVVCIYMYIIYIY
jgi:hypothetical protein